MTRKSTLLSLYCIVAIGCLFGALTSAADAPGVSIRIGILGSVEDEDYDGALVLKDYVESRTNGEVSVDIFASGQFCGNERECIENMRAGVLDVFMTTFGGLGNIFPPGQVFDLPYVFRNDRIAECVFDGPVTAELRDTVLSENLGMRLMVISNTGGWRNFATTSRPVRSPEDLKGIKIRTTSAPTRRRSPGPSSTRRLLRGSSRERRMACKTSWG